MKISFQKYLTFIVLPVIAAASLLYLVASNNVSQYFTHEAKLAAYSVNAADSLIQQHLKNLRKNVGYFTENFHDKIKRLASNPDDPDLYSELDKLVRTYFPEAVTFTIADNEGGVMLKDGDSLIGKGCRENIRLFTINSLQSDAQLRIHSDSRNYHFDIMHEMHTSDGRLFVFFISFEPVIIADYISHLQMPGHTMMVIKKDADSLIEITESGARVKLEREKNLSEEERERILASKDVEKTLWRLVDMLDNGEIEQTMYIIFRDFGIIFISFVLGILLAFVIIIKHEKLRFHAESKLDKLSQ